MSRIGNKPLSAPLTKEERGEQESWQKNCVCQWHLSIGKVLTKSILFRGMFGTSRYGYSIIQQCEKNLSRKEFGGQNGNFKFSVKTNLCQAEKDFTSFNAFETNCHTRELVTKLYLGPVRQVKLFWYQLILAWLWLQSATLFITLVIMEKEVLQDCVWIMNRKFHTFCEHFCQK